MKKTICEYDIIIGMETRNIRNMKQICGGDPEHKFKRLLDYTDSPRDLPDPWYTEDFDSAWRDVNEGCRALLRILSI